MTAHTLLSRAFQCFGWLRVTRGAESRWSTIIQDETYSFPTLAEWSSNAKAMEAERTIKDKKKKKEQIRGRQENRSKERAGEMLAVGPGVWSFVQCILAWFEGPLLGALASLYDLKESFCIYRTVWQDLPLLGEAYLHRQTQGSLYDALMLFLRVRGNVNLEGRNQI